MKCRKGHPARELVIEQFGNQESVIYCKPCFREAVKGVTKVIANKEFGKWFASLPWVKEALEEANAEVADA